MAEVIARLKVESKEYEAKINRAKEGLLQLERTVRNAGESFLQTWKDEQAFAKALGQMQTVSKSAAGQLSELKGAFVDLSMVYKRMTDEEKKSPFGKALSSSLSELKTRIDEAKGNLSDVTKELNGGGGGGGLKGALDAVASKFGLNIQQLAGWGAALGAAKLGLEAMKKTIDATESSSDELAQAQLELSSAVNSFFRNMNEGSFTNFLQGLSDVASMAREAYQAMDELGSYAVRYNPRNSADMQRIDKLLKEARALQAKGDKEGAAAKTAEATRVAEEAKANTTAYGQKEYDAGMSTLKSLLGGTGVKFTEGQIEYYSDPKNWEKVKYAANDYGTALKNLQTAEANLASIGQTGNNKMIALYNERYQAAKRAYDAQSESNRRAYTYLNTRDTAGTEQGDKFIRATQQIYGKQMAEYAVDAIQARIDRADAVANKVGGGKTGGGSGTTVAKELNPMQQAQKEISALTEEALTADEGRLEVIKKEIAALQEQVRVYQSIQDYAQGKEPNWKIHVGDRKAFEAEQKQIFEANGGTASRLESMQYSVMKEIKVEDIKVDTETLHTLLKDALQKGIDTTSLDLTTIAEQIGEGINVPDETWQAILDKYNELRAQIGEEPITINFNTGKITEDGKNSAKTWKDAASAVQSVGQAFNQIEDPAAKVAGTLAQAIASVALGYATATTQAASMGPWAWVAFAAAGLAQMVATISTIKSVAHFAEGGIVGGNDYTDNTPIMVSSGELILNRSQQENIASQLIESDEQGVSNRLPFVTGEKIVLGVNNWGRRTGRGELVFSR